MSKALRTSNRCHAEHHPCRAWGQACLQVAFCRAQLKPVAQTLLRTVRNFQRRPGLCLARASYVSETRLSVAPCFRLLPLDLDALPRV